MPYPRYTLAAIASQVSLRVGLSGGGFEVGYGGLFLPFVDVVAEGLQRISTLHAASLVRQARM